MQLIKPFQGLLPNLMKVQEIIAPPYDAVTRDEAKAIATSPWNCLHLTRADIDVDNINLFDPSVYHKAKDNWQHFLANNIFKADHTQHYYVYRIEQGRSTQIGLVCMLPLTAYAADRILRHQHTSIQTEFDRVETIKALNAQVSPTLMTYRKGLLVTNLLSEISKTPPIIDRVQLEDSYHSLWRVSDATTVSTLTEILDVADAHEVMPPQSTCFSPTLADGLIAYSMEDRC